MLEVKELQNQTIKDLADGREKLAHIQNRIYETVKQMERTKLNETWNRLSDQHYELKKAKRHIQGLMGKIVAERFKQK